MPGLEDVEDRGEGPFSDDEESSSDDEEAAEGKSYDSPSAVLGSGERQVRGGVQIDTPSPKLGPQLGGTPPREEDLEGGSRDVSPAPALANIDGDSSSDDEGPGEGSGPGPPPPGPQPPPTPRAPPGPRVSLQDQQAAPGLQAPHPGPPGPRAPPRVGQGAPSQGDPAPPSAPPSQPPGPPRGRPPIRGRPRGGAHWPTRGWGWGSTSPHGRRRWAPTSPP